MGPQVGLMPPPSAPGPSSQRHRDTRGSIISRDTWPKSLNERSRGQGVSILCPIVVPKFVANPSMPVQPGYQKAHGMYDEMRQFFAQKANSVHNGEVVIIKVTMMSMKPGNKNPSVVSVRETTCAHQPIF